MMEAYEAGDYELGEQRAGEFDAAVQVTKDLRARRQRKIDAILRVKPHAKLTVEWGDTVTPEMKERWGPILTRMRQYVGIGPPPIQVKVEAKVMAKGERSHYLGTHDGMSPTVVLAPDETGRTFAHELGHWIESESQGLVAKAVEFRKRRTLEGEEGEYKLEPLSNYGHGYGPKEMTRRDWFMSAYIGKVPYGSVGKESGTEIVTEGLAYLVDNPLRFAREDADHFFFMYDLLRGR